MTRVIGWRLKGTVELLINWADTSGIHASLVEELITSQTHGLQSGGGSGAWAEERRQTAVTGGGVLVQDQYVGPPKTRQLE